MPQYDRVLPRGVEGLFRRVMRLCRGMLCFWVLVMQGRRVHVALSRGRLLQFPFHYVLKQTSDDRAQRSNRFQDAATTAPLTAGRQPQPARNQTWDAKVLLARHQL